MEYYVMRHGLTDWNLEKKIQGLTDIPLNETGIKQAQQAYQRLKDIHFDLVYCSPLTRTRQTAALATDNKYPIIADDLLIERDFGQMEGNDIVVSEVEKIWHEPIDQQYKNEETVAHMIWRAKTFINKIPKVDKVLIVTHGAFYRALRVVLENIDPTTVDLFSYKLDNCGIYKISKGSN